MKKVKETQLLSEFSRAGGWDKGSLEWEGITNILSAFLEKRSGSVISKQTQSVWGTRVGVSSAPSVPWVWHSPGLEGDSPSRIPASVPGINGYEKTSVFFKRKWFS